MTEDVRVLLLLLVTLQIQYLHLEYFGNAFYINIKQSGKECKLRFKIIELLKHRSNSASNQEMTSA